MGKRKIAIYGLVFLVIILCMITIYMQRENNKLRITNNRVDGDYEMLKKDYEQLYAAYYSYDKKILEILRFSDKVYWAEDSSAYVIKSESKFLFAFYKKPKMEEKYFLLWSSDELNSKNYIELARADTLKPHQFISKEFTGKEKFFIVAQKSNSSMEDEETPAKSISTIYVQ